MKLNKNSLCDECGKPLGNIKLFNVIVSLRFKCPHCGQKFRMNLLATVVIALVSGISSILLNVTMNISGWIIFLAIAIIGSAIATKVCDFEIDPRSGF